MRVFIAVCVLSLAGFIGSTSAAVCAGCPSTQDPNKVEYKNLLNKAVEIQNAKSNDEDLKVVSIDEVKTQVVAGTKYTVKHTSEGVKSKQLYSCETEFVLQPWINPEPQVLSHKCTKKM